MKTPTFKRQKALIALLEIFGGKLSKIELQKYMFLYIKEYSSKNYYAFVPYHYGSFSFEMYKDLHILQKSEYIDIQENDVILKDINMQDLLKENERKCLVRFYLKYNQLKGDKLIEYIYKKYPYYAIKSKIADKILDKNTLQYYRLQKSESAFFTIGYEGKKFEEYLNELIKNDIKVLVDVRKNAHSMKYGFSKKTLQNAVENLDMKYVHLPNLGIESENRQNLQTKYDYQKLFKKYEEALKYKKQDLQKLYEIFINNNRIAITCFEKDVEFCHRGVIARKLKNNYNIVVSHL